MNWKLWTRILFAEGFLLSGGALGWAFGVWSASSGTIVYALFACGMISLLTAATIQRVLSRIPIQDNYLRAVDLGDSFRAAKVYGSQPPVYNDKRVRTEAIAILGLQTITVPPNSEILLEHWEGPEIWVAAGEKRLKLSSQQVLRLEALAGALQLGQVSTELELGKPVDSMVLMHFISPN